MLGNAGAILTKKPYPPQEAKTTIGAVSVFTAHTSQLTPSGHTHRWRPPTDVTETETHIVVTVEIAGMEDAEFHITLRGKQLAVSGKRERHSGIHAFHQMEISYGEFATNVKLPSQVESEGVDANYADGFLTVRLPKQRRHMPIIEID
jgi:HSP20 family molecular chaperone IbpA